MEIINTFLENYNVVLLTVGILSCLIISAAISGSEIAFFSILKEHRLKEKSDNKNDKHIKSLLKKPKSLLGTILITNNFINILMIVLFSIAGQAIFKDILPGVRFFIEVIVITFLILLFGEIIPKIYALRHPLRFARMMSKPILYLNIIFNPITKLLETTTKIFGNQQKILSVKEVSMAWALIDKEKHNYHDKILDGIVSFGSIKAREIMTPCSKITAISLDDTFEKVKNTIIKNGFSRYPVCKKNIEDVQHIIYAKDILPLLKKPDDFNWKNIVKPILKVHHDLELDNVLNDFQKERKHLAIVTDDNDKVLGIITLSNVINKIMGGINVDFETSQKVKI